MRGLRNPNDPNVVMLELVARRLGVQLCDQVAFVGGAIVGLLITDPANPPIRPTVDVDIVAEVLALGAYHTIEAALRKRGFTPDMRPDAPICRWQVEGVTVDVMPSDERILGFANRWYPGCVASADIVELPSGTRMRVISAPMFVATKLEAFHGRGAGDYLLSHDLGDILGVVDGRESLVDECRRAPAALRTYLADQFASLLRDRRFVDALPGHLPGDPIGQSRLDDLEAKLQHVATLAKT